MWTNTHEPVCAERPCSLASAATSSAARSQGGPSMTVSVLYRRILAVAVMIIARLVAAGLMNAANAAGSVSVQQGKLVVTGGSEANSFFVTGNGGGNFSVTDGTASISAGTNCNKDGSTVKCFGVTSGIRVLAGGGNDAVRLRSTF